MNEIYELYFTTSDILLRLHLEGRETGPLQRIKNAIGAEILLGRGALARGGRVDILVGCSTGMNSGVGPPYRG